MMNKRIAVTVLLLLISVLLSGCQPVQNKANYINPNEITNKAAAADESSVTSDKEPVSGSKLVTYPQPQKVKLSPYYSVKVKQGGETSESFAYISKNQFPEKNIYSEDTSWTSFSFSGKVTVVVNSLAGPVKSCKILPSRLGIEPRVYGDRIEFELSSPAQLSVEINGEIKHPMLVFADPLETEPAPEPGPNIIYFAPGYYDEGKMELKSGDTVYIAGGAYVKGYFEGGEDKKDITIRGRGILSGEDDEHKSHHMIQIMGKSQNIRIEGITIVNSPWTNIRIWGKNNTVRDVKMISWYYNTDGVLSGQDSLVENCFFKVNDDAIKFYNSGITVRNNTIWQLMNGAPFQISWNVSIRAKNCVVTDCDIIRVEHYNDWDNRGIFNSIHGGNGHISDYLFQNIYIENANFRFVKLIFKKTQYSEHIVGYGNISDLTFKNIIIADEMKEKNVLSGKDAEHGISNITFENVTINKRPLTINDFDIDQKSVSNVKILEK